MDGHDRPVIRKRLLVRPRRLAGPPGKGPAYADTPGWLLLVESGRGVIDMLGLLAAVWIAIRSVRRRLSGP
jgi:hypothetical protein